MDERRIDERKLKGAGGALLLFIGTFLPVSGSWFTGDLSYLRLWTGPGAILILLALVSGISVLAESYKPLWITGVLAVGFTGLPFFGALVQSIPLKYGWIVLFSGAVLIVSAAGNFPLVPYQVRRALGQGGVLEPPKPSPPLTDTKPAHCTECGAKLEAGTRFCADCGSKVITPEHS